MKRTKRDDPVALVIDLASSSSDEEEEEEEQQKEQQSNKIRCTNCRKGHSKCSSLQDGIFPCKRCKDKKKECIPVNFKRGMKESDSKTSSKSSKSPSSKSSASGKSNNKKNSSSQTSSSSSIVQTVVKKEEEPKKKRKVVKDESDDSPTSKPLLTNLNGHSQHDQIEPFDETTYNNFERYSERLLEVTSDDGRSNTTSFINNNNNNNNNNSMNIFLARMPNGDLNLMRAPSLLQSKIMLEKMVAEPETAMIYQYDGPLCFGFSPTVRPLASAEQYMINQVSTLSKSRDTLLHQHFVENYKKNHMLDCKFRVYDVESKTEVDLECHSAVVLSFSPYLRSLVKPTATQPVFKFGNKFHYVNKNALLNIIEFLYLGKKIAGSMDELFDIVLCSILMDIEEVKYAACLTIITKLFKEGQIAPLKPKRAAKIVGVLHFADEHFLQLLIQAIFNRIVREDVGEELKQHGLSKHLLEKLRSWQEYRDGVVWNEEGLTKDVSMKLDNNTLSTKTWHKLTKTAYPNRQYCQSKEDLKEVIISEQIEHDLKKAKEATNSQSLSSPKKSIHKRVVSNQLL
ncbi:hypothetical protein NAEGRDRAFT_59091 [Naegleria gruberi]|uniref:BTB domain-containing protein n=1 Tax=Naegleria gruberi TaxID=5762 RepID=D2VSF5_NAEGR|nr:uncharacterized protein NAEGRDRAFT_59091 [Naegleria gruberi]EFC40112.1 hypothetical protein NAEGRDRAFT_59091 [Naegleria gruberi]|eukprot:XP_002672856.1 hypothetical protein NAEGRDRAFT_59091 [Naegleria gruberi strain NEG-M]